MTFVPKWKGTTEFVEETVFGTTPTNPAMLWPGIVTMAKPVQKPKVESKFYLRQDYAATSGAAATSDGVSGARKHFKVGEEAGLELEIVPQAGTLLTIMKYAWGGTVALPTTVSDIMKSTSWAMKSQSMTGTNVFNLYKGSVMREITLTIPEDNTVTLKATLDSNEVTSSSSDYVGSGSHAYESAAAGLTSGSLAQIGSGEYIAMRKSAASPTAWSSAINLADAVKSLEFRIVNKLTRVKDLQNTTSTRTKGFVCNSRDYVLSMELNYDDISVASADNKFSLTDIRSLTPFDIQFAIDGYKYTLVGVRWPELPYDWGSDDLLADKVTSLPITGYIESGAWQPAFSVAVNS
jgi:hypothetical protein